MVVVVLVVVRKAVDQLAAAVGLHDRRQVVHRVASIRRGIAFAEAIGVQLNIGAPHADIAVLASDLLKLLRRDGVFGAGPVGLAGTTDHVFWPHDIEHPGKLALGPLAIDGAGWVKQRAQALCRSPRLKSPTDCIMPPGSPAGASSRGVPAGALTWAGCAVADSAAPDPSR